MSEVKAIQIAENQYIYVEVDGNEDVSALPKSTHATDGKWQSTGPQNSSICGPVDDAIDALKALQQNIKTLSETVHKSFEANQPEEWTLEINIGFKGNVSPIPVILSGEASGAIKVTATWKK